ncbi:MAG: prolyl oligopeptidase family serine peptidase [Planctomycetota bacterium]
MPSLHRLFVASLLLIGLSASSSSDGPADNSAETVRPIPPIGDALDEESTQSLLTACRRVRSRWAETRDSVSEKDLVARGRLDDLESEVLVFPRAVELAIEFQQFYQPRDVTNARTLLDEALVRIQRVEAGATWAQLVGAVHSTDQQLAIGGFRSRIDGSIQPYALVIPAGWVAGDSRVRRLDIWFHGRGEKLSEAGFLSKQSRDAGQYTPADTIVLHPYGRYTNAFRFAGEVDVFEALDYVKRRLPVDSDRISVRGFSMGGAACWQFATHYADRWFAANPGAGFSETAKFLDFFQGEPVEQTTPAYQKKLWRLYDNPPWAENLLHCPTVVYSGEVDRQKQAADVMEARLSELSVEMTHVIGPGTGHKIHPEAKQVIEAKMDRLAKSADFATPRSLKFVTHTLRYHRMHWIDVQGLQRHWSPATVQASVEDENRISVTTDNVSRLTLDFKAGQWPGRASGSVVVTIDNQMIPAGFVHSDRSFRVPLANSHGQWMVDRQDNQLRKRPGMQGPIDDAFMDSFVFVLPSSSSKDTTVEKWTKAESEHAMKHWRQHFRGDVRRVLDTEVTDEMIAKSNLVAFGDPDSNALIARMADRLPVSWSDSGLNVGDHQVPRPGHVPILVYPNPLNPSRYLVLNSGFTYREYDYLNNARQTPKLPDWALVNVRDGATTQTPGEVILVGFFDENWRVGDAEWASN